MLAKFFFIFFFLDAWLHFVTQFLLRSKCDAAAEQAQLRCISPEGYMGWTMVMGGGYVWGMLKARWRSRRRAGARRLVDGARARAGPRAGRGTRPATRRRPRDAAGPSLRPEGAKDAYLVFAPRGKKHRILICFLGSF